MQNQQAPPVQQYVPRADDLDAGIRASLAGRRPEELEVPEEGQDEEGELYTLSQRPDSRVAANSAWILPSSLGLVLLTETAPRWCSALPFLKTPLHFHQLAELHEMVEREKTGRIVFTHPLGEAEITTNIGILGDIPGYGKTLTALAITGLSHPVVKRHTSGLSLGAAGIYTRVDAVEYTSCTLIICSSRLIKHWIDEITTHTHLRYTVYKEGHFFTWQDVQNVDIVLATPSLYYGCKKVFWKRVIIDEVDTLKLPGRIIPLKYAFIWLITGSFEALATRGAGWIHSSLLHEFLITKRDPQGHRDLLNRLVIKADDNFVTGSSTLAEYIEETIYCATPGLVKASREFITTEVAEMLASGDIERAIVALGGQAGTQTNVMDLIRHNTERDLKNEEVTLRHLAELDIDEESRQTRTKRAQEKIKHLKDRLKEIETCIKDIGQTECKICYTELEGPTMLTCCHNIFCGRCLIGWFNQWLRNTCPMCRQHVDVKKQMIAITLEDIATDATFNRPLTKIDALRIICQQFDKILVFANYPGALELIRTGISRRDADIPVPKACDVFTGTNTTIFESFRQGKLPILILDPRTTAGIALKEAEIVVLYHDMPPGLVRQAIGRAQRLGRKQRLVVYKLYYTLEKYTV